MREISARTALFAGLVEDDSGRPVDVALVGGEPCYVVDDDGFRVHVPSEPIDRHVIETFRQQFLEHREIATEAMLQMLGKDDLFTKAMIDSSIENMAQVIERGLPEDARAWLGMLGFRVVINAHGEVVRLEMPEQADPDGE
jgi:hypothetical protein